MGIPFPRGKGQTSSDGLHHLCFCTKLQSFDFMVQSLIDSTLNLIQIFGMSAKLLFLKFQVWSLERLLLPTWKLNAMCMDRESFFIEEIALILA